MRDEIIQCTREALTTVSSPRFFKTERGYAGVMYCALMTALNRGGLLKNDRILEMEHQKRQARHGMRQRPDIIFHIPVEVSGENPNRNNYAVWALKMGATDECALEDFHKLDKMFGRLNYPLGFFINIDSTADKLELYDGEYRDRLYGAAVRIVPGKVELRMRSCEEALACRISGQSSS